MKITLSAIFVFIICIITSISAIAQNGFKNKAEAKNEYKDSLKEGKWIEYADSGFNTTIKDSAVYYYLTLYKAGKEQGAVRYYSIKNENIELEIPYTDGKRTGDMKVYADNNKQQQLVIAPLPVILDLTSKKRLPHIKQLPFDKVVVFDNRFDTTNFRIEEMGIYPLKDIFNRPFPEAIKVYIENKISPYPKKNQQLYISIKQLRFGNLIELSQTLFFSADAYIKGDSGFTKIATVNAKYSFKHSYRRTISNAIDKFIEKVNADYYQRFDSSKYTMNDINSAVTNQWAVYPIMVQSTSINGIYTSFDNFKNNKITPADFSLQLAADSSYDLRFNDANNHGNIWAVAYNDTLYIHITGNCYMPLKKIGNKMYLHVPHILPNMFTIISPKFATSSGSTGYNSIPSNTNNNSVGAVLVEFAVILIISAVVSEVQANKCNKNKSRVWNNYKVDENSFRDCFIDMDDGDIIYY